MKTTGQLFESLVAIIAKLRDPNGGCPWDLKQTHETLKPYLIEEAYETIDAIERDPAALHEELGDLLLQILLHSQIASERGAAERFSIDEVIKTLEEKLIHRHPHIFGETKVSGSEEVLANWEKLKNEKKKRASLLDGTSPSLPGLLRSHKQGEAVARAGFDWWSAKGAQEKAIEELNEFLAHDLDDPTQRDRYAEELGDLLFTLAQVARKLELNAETLLHSANNKFERRFRKLEALAGKPLEGMSVEELEQLWQRVKLEE